MWKGTAATLKQKPTSTIRVPVNTSSPLEGGARASRSLSWARLVVTPPAAANSRLIPNSRMPLENAPSRKYFTPASMLRSSVRKYATRM